MRLRVGDFLLSAAAVGYRRLCRGTRFIAITGSTGKTTARALISAVLASRFSTNCMAGTSNGRRHQALAVLRTRHHHRFTVMEIGTKFPGTMRRAAFALDPDVVVVLNVQPMHSNRFQTLAAMAREKAALLGRLGTRGTAVLNRDDPRTWTMASDLHARVWSFGSSPDADVWASGVAACWPDRLEFDLHSGDDSYRVRTQLIGEHWIGSVLAAVCTGLACGIPLADAVRAVERTPPPPGRLEEVALANGAVLLRDDYNASVTTYAPALRVLESARADRRVAVVGDTWDSGLPVDQRLARFGAEVASAADLAVFVGHGSERARQGAVAAGLAEDAAHAFPTTSEAAAFLRRELRRGDLVLLKGQWLQHMERVYWGQLGTVECRLVECDRYVRCEQCARLGFVAHDG